MFSLLRGKRPKRSCASLCILLATTRWVFFGCTGNWAAEGAQCNTSRKRYDVSTLHCWYCSCLLLVFRVVTLKAALVLASLRTAWSTDANCVWLTVHEDL